MSSYVVINLADRDGFGAISSLRQGITNKRKRTGLSRKLYGQHAVQQIDAFDLLEADRAGTLQRTDPGLIALRAACLAAKKIYLATHGTPTDVDHCFAKATGGAPLATARELARFMMLALPAQTATYNLALVMCYGARTSNFRSTNQNHQQVIGANDLRTSFAYKFFRELCVARKVRMTARTGAVAFDGATGQSMVEDEVAIDARIDKEAFLRQGHIVPTTQSWQQAQRQRAQNEQALNLPNNAPLNARPLHQFGQLNDAFKNNPGRAPTNDEERTVKDYQDMMRTKQGYIDTMQANPDRQKYGKIVYEYVAGQISVTNKYGDPTNGGVQPQTVLYQGPLI